jgi:hypothetical protein
VRERVTFEREMRALALRGRESEIADPTVWEVTVGQRILLDLATTPLKGNVDTVQWSIPGTRVRSYDGTPTRADVFDLTPTDLKQQRLVFFWVDAQDGRKVRARVTTRDGRMEDYVATFNVKAPSLERFDPVIRNNRIEKKRGLTALRLGELVTGSEGVEFTWSTKMPARRGGFVKDVQTVSGDRSQVLRAGAGTRRLVWRHPRDPTIHEQLDGSSGGEAGYSTDLWKVKHDPGASTKDLRVTDSPHSALPTDLKELKVNQRFFYFLMFKPDLPQAIWVPIAKAEWSWKVTATRGGGGFKIDPIKQAKPTITKSTTDFPLYTSNAAENEWLDPPK